MKSKEEKKAEFLAKAEKNKANWELHLKLIKQSLGMIPFDEELLKLIDYAEAYHSQFPKSSATLTFNLKVMKTQEEIDKQQQIDHEFLMTHKHYVLMLNEILGDHTPPYKIHVALVRKMVELDHSQFPKSREALIKSGFHSNKEGWRDAKKPPENTTDEVLVLVEMIDSNNNIKYLIPMLARYILKQWTITERIKYWMKIPSPPYTN